PVRQAYVRLPRDLPLRQREHGSPFRSFAESDPALLLLGRLALRPSLLRLPLLPVLLLALAVVRPPDLGPITTSHADLLPTSRLPRPGRAPRCACRRRRSRSGT